MEFDFFKESSETLETLYKKLLEARFQGFRLSETFQLNWFDPDFYLTPGSFAQRWITVQCGTRPEDITEDTVAEHIYTFLNNRFGSFTNVVLVEPVGLPSVEDLGDGSTNQEGSTRENGAITELTLAPGSWYREYGAFRDVHRLITSHGETTVIQGENDTQYVNPSRPLPERAVHRMLFQYLNYLVSSGTPEEPEPSNYEADDMPNQPNPQQYGVQIASYTYRDSTGEVHEHNDQNPPIPFDAFVNWIQNLESEITASQNEAPAQPGPAPRRATANGAATAGGAA